MRWRARLRRYRAPNADVGVNVLQTGVSAGGAGVGFQYTSTVVNNGLQADAVIGAGRPILH